MKHPVSQLMCLRDSLSLPSKCQGTLSTMTEDKLWWAEGEIHFFYKGPYRQ